MQGRVDSATVQLIFPSILNFNCLVLFLFHGLTDCMVDYCSVHLIGRSFEWGVGGGGMVLNHFNQCISCVIVINYPWTRVNVAVYMIRAGNSV